MLRATKRNMPTEKKSTSCSFSSSEDEEISLILVSPDEEDSADSHSVTSIDVSSQRTEKERNECAALNVATGATRSVQTNVKTELMSHAVSVSTTAVIYMKSFKS
jgi:hypothetical protein